MSKTHKGLALSSLAILLSSSAFAAQTPEQTLKKVEVTASSEDGEETPIAETDKTRFTSPVTKVRMKDIAKTNAVTTSDSVKYESGVFVRQRYIGDSNAPIGMRASNPYQGGRVMVFLDGMPIWNPLQASYNGSPRWGLAGPGEIRSMDIVSGPFSAEYSGNAMGGVVNINTALPQKREVYTEATYMLQPYSHEGTNQNLQGFKTFGSYGDKFGDFSSYFSYNRLENEGHPMTTFNYSNASGAQGGPLALATKNMAPVFGAFMEQNPKSIGSQANNGALAGRPRISYGDDGIYHSTDDLFKWKGGYAITPELNALFNVAYENLDITHTGQTYLTNSAGTPIYGASGVNYNFNGLALSASPFNFGASAQNRETLTGSAGLKGRLFGHWNIDTNVSQFDVLKDVTISSTLNPNDPNNKNAGQVSRYDNTGWTTFAMKFDNQEFLGRKDLSFATGYQYTHAQLSLNQYNSNNYLAGLQNSVKSLSGGDTDTHGVFGQMSWRFLPDWDATAGTRLERWNSSNGVSYTGASGSTKAVSANPSDRQESAFSPKFSLGYEPGRWKFRYSVAKAYRFPIAEELFQNSLTLNGSASFANSSLKPEDGTHHNLLAEYDFINGYVRLNLFHENVRNAIYSQSFFLPGSNVLSSAYSSVGEVETNGLDLTFNQDRVLGSPVDVKLNTTILDAKIISNPLNPNYVGKDFPLLPHYRAHLLTTYHYGKDWDFSAGTRYQSTMNSQLDNKDLQIATYAAFTQSWYVDLKATYRFLEHGHVSVGIDNVNDYRAFFNHPLPQRSYFAQVGYQF